VTAEQFQEDIEVAGHGLDGLETALKFLMERSSAKPQLRAYGMALKHEDTQASRRADQVLLLS
jgi:hypothetical protein